MAYVAIAVFVIAYMLIISEKIQRTVVGLTGVMLMIIARYTLLKKRKWVQ